MREIPLHGKAAGARSAVVDDEDFEFVNQWKWNYHRKGYAIRTDRSSKKRTVYMHKEIAVRAGICRRELQADHKNGNKLDNTRSNLREATNQMNQANVSRQKNNSTGFKGVSFKKSLQKWVARIGVNRTRIHLGYFSTPEEASEAYTKAAILHFGEFARS